MNISMPKIFFVGNLETTLCRVDKKMIERTDIPAWSRPVLHLFSISNFLICLDIEFKVTIDSNNGRDSKLGNRYGTSRATVILVTMCSW